jgi:hypothetical protein
MGEFFAVALTVGRSERRLTGRFETVDARARSERVNRESKM